MLQIWPYFVGLLMLAFLAKSFNSMIIEVCGDM